MFLDWKLRINIFYTKIHLKDYFFLINTNIFYTYILKYQIPNYMVNTLVLRDFEKKEVE